MSLPVADQALTLAGAVGLGLALGLIFDFLRAVRRRLPGRMLRGGLDLLFALFTLAALFTFGMATPLGRVQITTLCFVVSGAALYGIALRPVFFPVFEQIAAVLLLPLRCLGKIAKKIKIFSKKLFPKSEKWFTIIRNHHPLHRGEKGERGHAEEQAQDPFQEGRHCYHPALPGSDGIRPLRAGKRQGGASGAERSG